MDVPKEWSEDIKIENDTIRYNESVFNGSFLVYDLVIQGAPVPDELKGTDLIGQIEEDLRLLESEASEDGTRRRVEAARSKKTANGILFESVYATRDIIKKEDAVYRTDVYAVYYIPEKEYIFRLQTSLYPERAEEGAVGYYLKASEQHFNMFNQVLETLRSS